MFTFERFSFLVGLTKSQSVMLVFAGARKYHSNQTYDVSSGHVRMQVSDISRAGSFDQWLIDD
jgi:hypothetical protein